MRRVASIIIVGFWLVMLALLVRRSWVPAPAPADAPVHSAGASRDEWMNVYHEGLKIGYTHASFSADADGFSFSDDSLLRLVVMEAPQTVRTRLRGHTAPDLSLRDVEFELSSGAGNLRATGVVESAGLRLKIYTGKDVSEQMLPVKQPLYLPSTLQASLNAKLLRPGNRFEVSVFDPISLKNDRMAVIVEGQEPLPGGGPEQPQAWRLRQEFRGFKTTAWTDAGGTVLREEGPMGMVLVRTSAEQALNRDWTDEVAHDLVASAAVPVARPIDDPRQRMVLRLRLSGIALEKVPVDDEQMRDAAVLTIRRSGLEALPSYQLPCTDSRYADDLQPTAFLQSDHPRVRDLARQIVGADHDAARAAVRLNDWVYEHLRKVPTISIPNALQVLDMGQGDCNEHAVLLAALGRAAGIPTRTIAGTVYIDGAFLYHAWCEMWLGRWVSIDPALHQFPADATHLKLVVGGPDEQLGMIDIIGHLGIEVLEDTAEVHSADGPRQ
jgi:Transglutaminase-like superfamily